MISSSVKPLFFIYDRACLAVNDLSFNMDLYSSGNTTLISCSWLFSTGETSLVNDFSSSILS